ncbi:MAG: hypothetical protein AB1778_07775 [Candidatus Bipolaricaulota bacterium]
MLVDEFEFDLAVVHRGRHQPLFGEALEEARRKAQARIRQPRPPRIQALLRQGLGLKERLAADPGVDRDAMAREAKLDPSQLTGLLHLADLSPAIQAHILGLPPAVGRGLLTERRLRPIARISDHREQERLFKALLRKPLRAPKVLAVPIPSLKPTHGPLNVTI